MLFKTELTEVFTMAEMDKIVKVLSAKTGVPPARSA